MQRLFFDLADTGTVSDTGVAHGALKQIRYVADTGGTINIAAFPNAGDTGDGYVIYSAAIPTATGKGQGLIYPRGRDTGSSDGVPHMFANERLRVQFQAQTGSTASGTFKAWVYLCDCC